MKPSHATTSQEVGHAYGRVRNSVVSRSWRRFSKCVFVPVLSRDLEPVGASYSVRG